MVGNVLNRRVLLPACGAAMWLLFSHGAAAQQSVYPPLDRTNFAAVAPQGFGDRQNSWAWSMTWFNNKLYVGTNRAMDCVNKAAIKLVIPSAVYPPTDPRSEEHTSELQSQDGISYAVFCLEIRRVLFQIGRAHV